MSCPQCSEKVTPSVLQCSKCLQWFHFTCLGVESPLSLIPYLLNYTYTCQKCAGGEASIDFVKTSWRDSIVTTLANLMIRKERKYFHTTIDITPFIEENWKIICFQRPFPVNSLKSSVGARLYSTIKDFEPLGGKRCAIGYYSLKQPLSSLHPHSTPSVGIEGLQEIELKQEKIFDYSTTATPEEQQTVIQKRRIEDETSARTVFSKRNKASATALTVVTSENERSFVSGNEHPFDRDGFVYTCCDKDPVLSSVFRLAFPIHGVILSAERSSPCVLIDRATRCFASNSFKKYRSVKASHSASSGSYYFEVIKANNTGNFRIGVAEIQATLQAPVGYDKHGYGLRDVDGSIVHCSERTAYSNGLTDETVVGVLVEFPVNYSHTRDYSKKRTRIPIRYKGSLFFEEKMPSSQTPNDQYCQLSFFYNGVCQGKAFDIPLPCSLFPMISLYDGASVVFNPGPNFLYPIDCKSNYYNSTDNLSLMRPWIDLYVENEAEEAVGDLIDELEFLLRTEESVASQ